jgi:hypothetical protein
MSNLLISIHPETRDGTNAVFDLETKHFSQGAGTLGFEWGRNALHRTIKYAEIAEKSRFRTKTN